MAEEEEDRFASIIDQCKYSSSQEDLLRYCLFCRESQEGLLALSSPESSISEELEAVSQGLIICSPPDTQPEEELQVASQGRFICSLPEIQPEEEFQTPEERLHLVSSEEQWMELDERVESKIDGDTDVFDGESIDLDGTVDLGNDRYVNFSEENSAAVDGSPVLKAANVDDDNSVPFAEKSPEGKVPIQNLPLQESLGISEPTREDLGLPELIGKGLRHPGTMNEGLEPKPMCEGLGLLELMNKGLEPQELMEEGLGLSEPMTGCLDDTVSKNLITSEMNLQLPVIDNVESSVGKSNEICLGGVAEKTIESLVEKNLESLKSRCNSPSMSQNVATYENVDVNAHPVLHLENDGMLIVHPVTNEVEVLEIAARKNSGVLMCFMDADMEDATPISIEKCLVPETSAEKVLDLDNPQTDVVNNDEEKRGSHNMEGLGEVKKTCSVDSSPEYEDPSGLLKLPNLVGGKDSAMGNARQGEKRRLGKADCFNRSVISKVGEMEGSGCGGGRVKEVDGIDTRKRLGEGMGLGQCGKRIAGEAGCSSIVTEALSSGNKYGDLMNILAATFLRENDQNAWNGHGGGRVEEVGGSGNAGRKMQEGKDSGSHGKETARVKEIGNGGVRVEVVDGSGNAGRRSGEVKGSASHGKAAGDSESSSRVTSSGNQSQAMMNLLTASFLRETNVNRGNADNSNESSQNAEDILEVAIQAGLEFPRPRWWKLEGYETKRDN